MGGRGREQDKVSSEGRNIRSETERSTAGGNKRARKTAMGAVLQK